ncbi:NAD(P)-binding protein [Thozetella sp. PMI_491]|nr:NAD(P)-binding protein [Thozetella sp. PMI_491]
MASECHQASDTLQGGGWLLAKTPWIQDKQQRVFIVTGSTSGIGKCLVGILYGPNAEVYMADRSHEKATVVSSELRANHPESKGQLVYLHLDLNDLSSVKKSAEEFLAKEEKLHMLFNNTGIMAPPEGIKTTQGYELQLGINAIAPFPFTKPLMLTRLSTAKSSAVGDVRVVWASSSFAGYCAPDGGVDIQNLDYRVKRHDWVKYGIREAACILYSVESARRYGQDGISVSLDPGVLKTKLLTNTGWLLVAVKPIEHDPIYGAYTQVGPWGRIQRLRGGINMACRRVEDGGTGNAKDF